MFLITLNAHHRLQPAGVLLAALLCLAPPLSAQNHTPLAAPTQSANRRTHLILKDGSYQVVMSYKVQGDKVVYLSAERGGETEEIPLDLVDLVATKRYETAHSDSPEQTGKAPVLDPELAKEESERLSRTPEVAPDLRLDTTDSVLLLDTFQGTPELITLSQSGGELNKKTGHSILKGLVNPMSASHQIVELRGQRAAVQAHVAQPVLYLAVGEDSEAPTGSAPMVVDTRGNKGNAPVTPSGASPNSQYVIVRADIRQDVRILTSFKISALGMVKRQEDVVETTTELLPGGHWMKLTPTQPLLFGEYALMEVISEKEVNLGVWDFGVHPTAPENRDAIKPTPKRPATLERRPRN